MKSKITSIVLTICMVMTVAGCGQEPKNTIVHSETEIEDRQQEAAMSEEAISGEEEMEDEESNSLTIQPEDRKPVTVMLENPSWDYYIADQTKEAKSLSIELEEVTQESNEIVDNMQWFVTNNLPVAWNADFSGTFPQNEDENYKYITEGDAGDWYQLKIYDKATDALCYDLDFSQYRYANDFLPQDQDFVGQSVWYAQIVDQVLYVSVGHLTYADSSPHTAYIVAIDLEDISIIWKTKPLVSNAYSFAIVGDYIVSGYGFTAEKDYLKVVDRETGTVMKEYPIKTMAEHIIYKDDLLYVRTYNMNYTYRILDK